MTYEAWLARRRPHVRERILRLNPNGVERFSRPKGYHPHEGRKYRTWSGGLLSRPEVIQQYGRPAADLMPEEGKIHLGGKRWAYRWEAVVDQIWLMQQRLAGISE